MCLALSYPINTKVFLYQTQNRIGKVIKKRRETQLRYVSVTANIHFGSE